MCYKTSNILSKVIIHFTLTNNISKIILYFTNIFHLHINCAGIMCTITLVIIEVSIGMVVLSTHTGSRGKLCKGIEYGIFLIAII